MEWLIIVAVASIAFNIWQAREVVKLNDRVVGLVDELNNLESGGYGNL